jgi:hypothetical protein
MAFGQGANLATYFHCNRNATASAIASKTCMWLSSLSHGLRFGSKRDASSSRNCFASISAIS